MLERDEGLQLSLVEGCGDVGALTSVFPKLLF